MAWLTAITGFLGTLSPFVSIFGAGLGALVSYFVGQWILKQNQQKQAIQDMAQEMDDHAGDGALSVADEASAQSQIDDLNQQLQTLDAQQPTQEKKP